MINSGREWDFMDDYIDKEYNFIVEAIESGIVVGWNVIHPKPTPYTRYFQQTHVYQHDMWIYNDVCDFKNTTSNPRGVSSIIFSPTCGEEGNRDGEDSLV